MECLRCVRRNLKLQKSQQGGVQFCRCSLTTAVGVLRQHPEIEIQGAWSSETAVPNECLLPAQLSTSWSLPHLQMHCLCTHINGHCCRKHCSARSSCRALTSSQCTVRILIYTKSETLASAMVSRSGMQASYRFHIYFLEIFQFVNRRSFQLVTPAIKPAINFLSIFDLGRRHASACIKILAFSLPALTDADTEADPADHRCNGTGLEHPPLIET